MKLGTTAMSTLKLGTSQVAKVYLGTTEVWSNVIDPLTLSPTLWLKANALSLSDGDPVSSWTDSSASGWHATASGTIRPKFYNNAINGKPAIRFDGITQRLDVTAAGAIARNKSGASLFVVQKHATAATQKAVFVATTNTHGYTRLGLYSNAAPAFMGRSNTETGSSAAVTSTATAATVYLFSGVAKFSTNPIQLWKNGVSAGTANFPTTGNTPNTDSAGVTVGALMIGASTWDLPFDGDIAEILYFPTALSDTDRQAVEAYLNSKYAIY